MAFTRVAVPNPNYVGAEIWKWTGGAQGDIGEAVLINFKADVTVSWKAAVPGTSTLALRGAVDPDAVVASDDGFTLHDTRGPSAGDLIALALTVAKQGRQILEAPYKIWPVVSAAGGATGVEVWLIVRGR